MCEKCKKPFELTLTISERANAKVKCPTCKGPTVRLVPAHARDTFAVEDVRIVWSLDDEEAGEATL